MCRVVLLKLRNEDIKSNWIGLKSLFLFSDSKASSLIVKLKYHQ